MPIHKLLPGILALTLAATACGTSGEGDEVASLQTEEVATLADAADAAVIPDEDGPEADPEEAALAFSQCMRDEGLDFPDLSVDAEGNIDVREGFESIDRSDASFRTAIDACRDELANGGFGGGRRQAFESPEVQDGLVAYSDCIREKGFDVGDLTFGQGAGAPGQGAGAGAADGDGEGTGPAEGRRQGGFGNITNRLAQQLGLDPEDPDVVAALDACQPVLDEAFAGTALGDGGTNAESNG
ncbi:MAG: hypothetical protein ACR2QK_21240 [Acidimicrobiales bacterium]